MAMTDEATERQTALPIEPELAEAIGALSADAFEALRLRPRRALR